MKRKNQGRLCFRLSFIKCPTIHGGECTYTHTRTHACTHACTGASAMRVPIVCTIHVRTQLAACTTITIRTVTYATYVECTFAAAVRRGRYALMHLFMEDPRESPRPDAAIRRNRASLQRRSCIAQPGIYIRNFRSLTVNMPLCHVSLSLSRLSLFRWFSGGVEIVSSRYVSPSRCASVQFCFPFRSLDF